MQVVDPSCPRQWGSRSAAGGGGRWAAGKSIEKRRWQTTRMSVCLACGGNEQAAGREGEGRVGRTEMAWGGGGRRGGGGGGGGGVNGRWSARIRNLVEESGLLVLAGLMGRQRARSGASELSESGAKRHLFFFSLPRALAPLLPVGGATRTENGVDSGAKRNRWSTSKRGREQLCRIYESMSRKWASWWRTIENRGRAKAAG
nr:hypothetical protein B9J10.290 [imported] - Neurospora crassa [Neurospora crassa]